MGILGVAVLITLLVVIGIIVVYYAIVYWHVSLPIIVTCVILKYRHSFHLRRIRNRRVFTRRSINRMTSVQNSTNHKRFSISVGGKSYIVNEMQHLKLQQYRDEYSRLISTHYDDFLRRWNANLKNISIRGNKLYEIKNVIPHKKIRLLRYTDPSTGGEYISPVPENIKTADEGMAWKFYLTEDEYDTLNMEA